MIKTYTKRVSQCKSLLSKGAFNLIFLLWNWNFLLYWHLLPVFITNHSNNIIYCLKLYSVIRLNMLIIKKNLHQNAYFSTTYMHLKKVIFSVVFYLIYFEKKIMNIKRFHKSYAVCLYMSSVCDWHNRKWGLVMKFFFFKLY